MKAGARGYVGLITAIETLNKLPADKTSTVNIDELTEKCYAAMDDDLNTPILIAHLFEGVRIINALAAKTEKIDAENLEKLKQLFNTFVYDVLGLQDEKVESDTGNQALGRVLDMVMSIRTDAKQRKDWATSDKIRNEIQALGFEIKDGKEGTTWRLN